MGLTNEERMLVNSEIQVKGKSTLTSYLLLIFLGSLGIHRFYLGETITGAIQLTLNVLGWLTFLFFIGFLFWFVLGVWIFVDLFLIPGLIEKNNRKIEQDVIASLKR